jgi:hypothetical protein
MKLKGLTMVFVANNLRFDKGAAAVDEWVMMSG